MRLGLLLVLLCCFLGVTLCSSTEQQYTTKNKELSEAKKLAEEKLARIEDTFKQYAAFAELKQQIELAQPLESLKSFLNVNTLSVAQEVYDDCLAVALKAYYEVVQKFGDGQGDIPTTASQYLKKFEEIITNLQKKHQQQPAPISALLSLFPVPNSASGILQKITSHKSCSILLPVEQFEPHMVPHLMYAISAMALAHETNKKLEDIALKKYEVLLQVWPRLNTKVQQKLVDINLVISSKKELLDLHILQGLPILPQLERLFSGIPELTNKFLTLYETNEIGSYNNVGKFIDNIDKINAYNYIPNLWLNVKKNAVERLKQEIRSLEKSMKVKLENLERDFKYQEAYNAEQKANKESIKKENQPFSQKQKELLQEVKKLEGELSIAKYQITINEENKQPTSSPTTLLGDAQRLFSQVATQTIETEYRKKALVVYNKLADLCHRHLFGVGFYPADVVSQQGKQKSPASTTTTTMEKEE